MSFTENQPAKRLDRRGFLRSIFGLGADGLPAFEAKLQKQFVWTDLRTGQMGFPFGLAKIDILPGAAIYPIVAAALLDQSLIATDFTYRCIGEITADKHSFTCSSPHGVVDLCQALARNCTTFFVRAARFLPLPTLLEYSEMFGLNEPVNTFEGGVFPKSNNGNSLSFAVGLNREMRPTPLQILRLYASIGRRGFLPVKMHSAEQTVEGAEPVQPHLKDSTWAALQKALRESSLTGAAKALDAENKMQISASLSVVESKTGFSHCVAGFFPYENPIYAVTIICPSDAADQAGISLASEILLGTEWL